MLIDSFLSCRTSEPAAGMGLSKPGKSNAIIVSARQVRIFLFTTNKHNFTIKMASLFSKQKYCLNLVYSKEHRFNCIFLNVEAINFLDVYSKSVIKMWRTVKY